MDEFKAQKNALVDGIQYLPGDEIDPDRHSIKTLHQLVEAGVLAVPDAYRPRAPEPQYNFGSPPAHRASRAEHEQRLADKEHRLPDGSYQSTAPVGQADQTPGPDTPTLDMPGGPAQIETDPSRPALGGAERTVETGRGAIETDTRTGERLIDGQPIAPPEPPVVPPTPPVLPPAARPVAPPRRR